MKKIILSVSPPLPKVYCKKMSKEKVAFPKDPKEYIILTLDHISNSLEISIPTLTIFETVKKHETTFFSHKFKWKKEGIPFERGVFLYIIGPFLGLSNDRPNYISLDRWVIDFYNANPQLKEAFHEAEKELFLPKG